MKCKHFWVKARCEKCGMACICTRNGLGAKCKNPVHRCVCDPRSHFINKYCKNKGQHAFTPGHHDNTVTQ